MKNLYKTFLLISISLNTVILSTNNKQYLKIFNKNRLTYYGVVLNFYNQKENQLESATNQLIKIKEISAEKLEKERIKKERLEKERLEKERLEKERLENERLENKLLERELLINELLEKERLENKLLERELLINELLENERLEKERLENGSILKKNILKIFNRTTTITLNNVKNSIISIIKLKKSPTSLEDADKILIALGIKTIWKPVKNPQGVFFKKTNANNKDIEEKLIDPMNKDIECINNKINEYNNETQQMMSNLRQANLKIEELKILKVKNLTSLENLITTLQENFKLEKNKILPDHQKKTISIENFFIKNTFLKIFQKTITKETDKTPLSIIEIQKGHLQSAKEFLNALKLENKWDTKSSGKSISFLKYKNTMPEPIQEIDALSTLLTNGLKTARLKNEKTKKILMDITESIDLIESAGKKIKLDTN